MKSEKDIIPQNMVNLWAVVFDEVQKRQRSGEPADYESVILKALGLRSKRFNAIPDLRGVEITEDLVYNWIYERTRQKSMELRRIESDKALIGETLPDEEWRDVVGWPDYKVSSLGRVWSVRKIRMLKPEYRGKRHDKYPAVCLTDSEGHQSKRRIHRLVAQAFIPNPEGKDTVDHINENTEDNRVENLRWATNKENREYFMRNHGIEYNPNAWHHHAYEPHKLAPPPSDHPFEEWRNIPDWPEHFISTEGRIWSAYKAEFIGGSGNVMLQANGKKLGTTVRKLMEITFLPKPLPNMVLRYKDGNKHNWRLDNLEWVSAEGQGKSIWRKAGEQIFRTLKEASKAGFGKQDLTRIRIPGGTSHPSADGHQDHAPSLVSTKYDFQA